jgi:ABC-2 type transport system permease protein
LSLSSEITKTLAFTYRNVSMTRRNIFLMGDMLYWPFIAVLSIGFMLAFLGTGGRDTAVVLSGVVAMSVLQTCQLDVSYVMLFDMWAKSMKHTMAAPISTRHYLAGSWLFGIVRSTLTFLIITGIIRLMFGFNMLSGGFAATMLFLCGLYVSALCVGMSIIILLLSFGMRAEIAAWSIVSVLLLMCGVYYPVTVMPAAMQGVAHAIPLTLFLEGYRAAHGLSGTEHAFAKGFALSIVYFLGLYFLLRAAERRARRKGMILKMSE